MRKLTALLTCGMYALQRWRARRMCLLSSQKSTVRDLW